MADPLASRLLLALASPAWPITSQYGDGVEETREIYFVC